MLIAILYHKVPPRVNLLFCVPSRTFLFKSRRSSYPLYAAAGSVDSCSLHGSLRAKSQGIKGWVAAIDRQCSQLMGSYGRQQPPYQPANVSLSNPDDLQEVNEAGSVDQAFPYGSKPISILHKTGQITTMKHPAHYNILRMILHSNNIFQNHNLTLQRNVLHFCTHSRPLPPACSAPGRSVQAATRLLVILLFSWVLPFLIVPILSRRQGESQGNRIREQCLNSPIPKGPFHQPSPPMPPSIPLKFRLSRMTLCLFNSQTIS